MKNYFIVAFCLALSIKANGQTIHLKTEHYPPFNYDLSRAEEGTGVGGAATKIVKELMRRSGYDYTLNLVSWKRAFGAAKDEKYNAVYCIVRTPEREKLFKWVGPIAENNYVLLSDSHREVSIGQFEDLKNYTIGAYRGSAGESFIKNANIPLESVRSDHLNALKLERGRIDLWVAGHLYANFLIKQLARDHQQLSEFTLTPVYTLQSTPMYIAFNLDTPDEVIKRLSKTIEQMRKEGFLERVYRRYE